MHVACKTLMQLVVLSVALRIRSVYSCAQHVNGGLISVFKAKTRQGRKWLWACLDLVFVVLCFGSALQPRAHEC